jgi:hypothetical protein
LESGSFVEDELNALAKASPAPAVAPEKKAEAAE